MSIVPLLSSQAGGAFGDTPLLIPNLGLWLKADAGVTLVSGAVNAWADQSGNGRDFSAPAGANRPAYSGTLNGLPVLTFDGGTDYLQGNAASLNIARNVSGLTVIAVVKYGAAAVQRVFSARTNAVATRVLMGVSTTQWQVGTKRLDADPDVLIAGGTVNTNFVIQSGVLRYSLATAGVFINSASQSDTAFQTAGNSSDTDSGATFVGASIVPGSFLNGDLAELIIYQRAISVEERNSVERYLSVKWGIAI
jgi:hypothetical protein